MSSLPFPQFLNRYGIKLLFASTADIVPGTILDKKRRGYIPIGHVEHVLGGPSKIWSSKLQPANFVYGTIKRNLSLKGKVSLVQFGIAVSGGLKNARSVTFEISGVKARSFKTQSKITILPQIQKIRRKNRRLWRIINNNWFADYVYYASEAKVTFSVAGGADLKAGIEKRVKISAGANINWESNRSFTITNNVKVPFGFSGWRV